MKSQLIITIVVILSGLQPAYSQNSIFPTKELKKCYVRDRRFYLEILSLAKDSTFSHEAQIGDMSPPVTTGRWKRTGDTLYLTYNLPDSAQAPGGRLLFYPKYLVKDQSLLPVMTGKKRKPRLNTRWGYIWNLTGCMDFLSRP